MKSKKIFYTLGFTLLILTSCKDEFQKDYFLEPSLSARYIQASKIEFKQYDSSSVEIPFSVVSQGASWSFAENADWLNLTPFSGKDSQDIILSMEENFSAQSRTSIFYLKSTSNDWNFSQTMSASQGGASPYLEPSQSEIEFSGAAGQQSISLYTNSDWEATCNSSWVHLSRGENGSSILIAVEENPSDTYRESNISFSYGNNKSTYLRVIQYPADISSSEESLTFDNNASKYNITIISQSTWNAIVSESWISINPSEGGAGEIKATIEVTPNESIKERRGFVTIRTSNYERIQIMVIQKGIYIESEKSLQFNSREQSSKIKIFSNTSWEITSYPEWVSIESLSGIGDGEVQLKIKENPSTQSRFGLIKISSPGLDINFEIEVIQLGQTLTTGVSTLQFTDKGGRDNFFIIADGKWSSNSSNDWFSSSPDSGLGDAEITVIVEENTTENDRSGKIIYSFIDQTAEVNIIQQSKYFEISDDSFNFDFQGGKHEIKIAGNQNWKANIENSVSWLALSSTSGSENESLTISVVENNTIKERRATIIIVPEYSQTIKINISQKGRSLSASSNGITFFGRGGTSDPIVITADGDFEITTDESWLSINKINNQTYTVTAQPNTSAKMRKGNLKISLQNLSEGEYSIEIPVTQMGEGGDFYIEDYPDDSNWNNSIGGNYLESSNSLTFKAAKETIPLNINSNVSWKIITYPEWLTISPLEGKGIQEINVTALENDNSSQRNGNIKINAVDSNLSFIINVTQEGNAFSIDVTNLQYGDEGGSSTINITSSISWSITTNQGWLSVSPMSGKGNAEITVNCTENPTDNERNGIIRFISGSQVLETKVIQKSKYFSVTPEIFNFDYKENNGVIKISSNQIWQVEIDSEIDWLLISQISGKGEESIEFKIKANNTLTDRSCTFKIKPEYSEAVTIQINQTGRSLSVSNTQISFNGKGGNSSKINIQSDGDYEISKDVDWFTIEKTDTNQFIVNAEPYKEVATREGKIIVSLKDLINVSKSVEIKVIQTGEGANFDIVPYPEDSDWSGNIYDSLKIIINGYSSDQNWN